jgi:hypothetical protein
MSDDFDRIASALGHRHRREALVALLERNPLTLEDLERLHAVPGPPSEDGSDTETTRIALVHSHLPKLESMGYVDWNQDSGTIVKGERWEEIGPVLELFEEHADELPVELA